MAVVPSALELFLRVWPAIFLVDLGQYVVAAAVMALLILVAAWLGFGPGPIQAKRPKGRDYSREIGLSLRSVLIFSLNGFGIYAAMEFGLVAIPLTVEAAGGWVAIVATFIGILLAHDAWFYWTHRLMHGPAMWRRVHQAHHRSHVPTPFAAYAFGIGEAWVQAIFLPLFLLIVPTHPGVISLFMLVMIVRNVMGHAGVEFHPAIFAPGRALGWLTTTTHHDLHHQTGRWNFGFYFTFWDRLMGTEHPDYAQRFLEARLRKRPLGAQEAATR